MLHEDLVWCFEAEAFSGSVVEAVHSEGDVLGRDGVEAHLFREELADQAVHILISPALPGGIGMSEEEVGIEFLGDAGKDGGQKDMQKDGGQALSFEAKDKA